MIETNGHTFGQQLVKISDSSNTILFCADLIPLISHIPLPYIMSYDLQPLVTLKEKEEILQKAAVENWELFFGHDPEIAIATVKQTDKGVRSEEHTSELQSHSFISYAVFCLKKKKQIKQKKKKTKIQKEEINI